MEKGDLNLVAIMDRHSHMVLTWRLADTMTASYCVAALDQALTHNGTPEIVGTDGGRSSPPTR